MDGIGDCWYVFSAVRLSCCEEVVFLEVRKELEELEEGLVEVGAYRGFILRVTAVSETISSSYSQNDPVIITII